MLTPRAERRHSAGFFAQLSLWWRSRGEQLPLRTRAPELLAAAPVIMVAVDTSHPDDQRHPALQWTTRQMASLNIEFRMICVSVIRAEMMGEGSAESSASGLQLTHLVRLRHWVDPLGLPEQRISLHVLESRDPADTLLDFARRNNVDLIVLGAPAPSDAALAWWRSVASTVTANASCSVHVVRVPERPRSQWHEWATDNTD
jgi:nucleotide-binding universal stress UspA family protein